MILDSMSNEMGLTDLEAIILCQVEIFDHFWVGQKQQINITKRTLQKYLIHKNRHHKHVFVIICQLTFQVFRG